MTTYAHRQRAEDRETATRRRRRALSRAKRRLLERSQAERREVKGSGNPGKVQGW